VGRIAPLQYHAAVDFQPCALHYATQDPPLNPSSFIKVLDTEFVRTARREGFTGLDMMVWNLVPSVKQFTFDENCELPHLRLMPIPSN
jgi:hypothetical protein